MFIKPYFWFKDTYNAKPNELEVPTKPDKLEVPLPTLKVPLPTLEVPPPTLEAP
jgi:hypothetical protein